MDRPRRLLSFVLASALVSSGSQAAPYDFVVIASSALAQNDAGQLALLVSLSDGRQLVVRADPSNGPGGTCTAPEPSSGIGTVAALLTLARVASRRTQRPERRVAPV